MSRSTILPAAAPQSGQASLRLVNLERRFGVFTAVDGVSLDIAPGELVSLLGPSGCGKTTILRMLAGFLKPTSGQIEVDGRAISTASQTVAPERRNMSMIFQSYAIWPHMTVGQNVAFGLKLRGFDSATIARKVEEILATVKLQGMQDRYPSEMSGGQQQRVALARAIVVRPAVLLLDEPLSNLDAALREEMRFEIRRLHDEFRFTTVYVTHDQGEAMVTSDRIVIMNRGRVEQIDTPHAIYNKPRTRFVAEFLGKTNILSGRAERGSVVFDGFAVRAERLGLEGAAPQDGLNFSLRPQSIRMAQGDALPAADGVSVSGRVVQRTYLGDQWDYIVRIEGSDTTLRVAAPPSEAAEVDSSVTLAIDPRQMAAVSCE